MTKRNSADVQLWAVDGYNLAPQLGTINETGEQETADITGFGVNWPSHHPTLQSQSFEVEGWYDDDTGSTHETLVAGPGVVRKMMYGVEGLAMGAAVTMSNGAVQSKYSRIAAIGDVHKAAAALTLSGEVEDGVLVAAVEARGAASSTEATYHDNGAASTQGAVGHLQVTDLTLGGSTDAVVKIRHSVDHVTWADLITFVGATAKSAQRIAVAGTVNRYTAIAWSWTGAGTGQSITAAVGLHRNPEEA